MLYNDTVAWINKQPRNTLEASREVKRIPACDTLAGRGLRGASKRHNSRFAVAIRYRLLQPHRLPSGDVREKRRGLSPRVSRSVKTEMFSSSLELMRKRLFASWRFLFFLFQTCLVDEFEGWFQKIRAMWFNRNAVFEQFGWFGKEIYDYLEKSDFNESLCDLLWNELYII